MSITTLDTWLNLFKDGFTAISVPITAIIAVRGLNTWQRQMKGAIEFELMRNVLRSTYKVRDTLKIMRSPFIWEGEGDEVIDENPNTHLTQMDKAQRLRWIKVNEAFAELNIVMNEAEVVWGAGARQKLSVLNKLYIDLGSALTSYKQLKQSQFHDEQEQKAIVELSKIIYQRDFNENTDAFDSELSQAINQIEIYVRSKVK